MPERTPPILPPNLPNLPGMGPPVFGMPQGKVDFSWLSAFLSAWREDLPVFLVLVGLFFLGVWGALGGASSPVEVVAGRVAKGLT